jgi:excisionase family DNA binding protein
MELAPQHMQPAPAQLVTAWLITAKQVAQILGISTRTVWNLVAEGDLATVKVTETATRFWLSDVNAYAQRRTRRADPRLGSGKADKVWYHKIHPDWLRLNDALTLASFWRRTCLKFPFPRPSFF